MSNFSRALGLCLRRPFTLAAALACSVLVAGFWGANIGGVYPLMEVLLRNQSLPEWVESEIATCEQAIARADAEIDNLRSDLAHGDPAAVAQAEDKLFRQRQRRLSEAKALRNYQWAKPWVSQLPRRAFTSLLVVAGLLMLGTLLKSAFLMGSTILVERAVGLTMKTIRGEYFASALRLDLASLSENSTAEFTSRFTYDMETLTTALRNIFCRATVEPFKMLACLAGAAWFNWRLLLVCLLLVPVAAVLMQLLARSIKRANRRAMEQMSHLVAQLSESIEAVQIVKAFTMAQYERSRFKQRAIAFYRKSMRIIFYNALTKPVSETLGVGVISLALLTGGYLVLTQQTHLLGIRVSDRALTPEAFFTFFALLAGAADPARKIADIWGMIQPGWPAADRIFAIIDRPPAIADPEKPQQIALPHRAISMDNVAFRYGDGPMVLSGIDIEIPFGQSVAIVGANGCGKSTLSNLIPRFHDPVAGSVCIDGVDIRQLALDDLRGRIGLVSQQTHLFDDTVRANIRYGSLDATDEQVEQAARQAHAHEFIVNRLERGYETMVGAGGGKLSGGQRQRIALARAILREPEILILDEATSQVDIESEQLVHQALTRFIRGRTAIMITHRLSTLALADRIIVMEMGQIVDQGTHAELISRCEQYQRLHDVEFRKSA